MFYLEGALKHLDFGALAGLDPGGTKGINITGDYAAQIDVIGTTRADTIVGTFGDDTIGGGAGADTLSGRFGNDTYVLEAEASGVDSISDEYGIDTITSSIKRSLAFADYSEIDNLTLTGSSKINGTGNALNNWLTGNGADNKLSGGTGNDTLQGGAGVDTLDGGAGLDVASYRGSSKSVTVDLNDVSKNTNDAKLDVFGSIAGAIGTSLADKLYGTSGANFLEGGEGADKLDGRGGLDTASYRNATAGVLIDLTNVTKNAGEAAGDTLSSIERFLGTQFADTIKGDANDNIIGSFSGFDVLTGGAGKDKFLFEYMGPLNTDTITDFESGTDKIQLLKTIFHEIGDTFDAGEVIFVASGHLALDGDDHFILDKSDSTLWYDRDANGLSTASLLCTFSNRLSSIKATDFEMV